jgi:hypothetical protein
MESLILQKSNTWGCVDFEGIRRTAERPTMIEEHLGNVPDSNYHYNAIPLLCQVVTGKWF